MFDRIKKAIHSWRVEHKTYEELSNLSDAQLADIGVERADIVRIANRKNEN